MLHSDPSGYSVDEVIAKLTDALRAVGADHSRARKLAETIERLRQMRDEQGSHMAS